MGRPDRLEAGAGDRPQPTSVVHADERALRISSRVGLPPSPGHGYVVVDEHGKLCGILTKGDVLKPVQTRLVLVDHNEMTQAVAGASEVTITEIIDHHRLGPLNTPQPILFINEPVGSTCTIVADLFRRERLVPSAPIAGTDDVGPGFPTRCI